MTEKSVKLKPCPFCGGEAELQKYSKNVGESFAVVCKKCETRTTFFYVNRSNSGVDADIYEKISKLAAVCQWNIRGNEPALNSLKCRECVYKLNYRDRAMCTVRARYATEYDEWFGLVATENDNSCVFAVKREGESDE